MVNKEDKELEEFEEIAAKFHKKVAAVKDMILEACIDNPKVADAFASILLSEALQSKIMIELAGFSRYLSSQDDKKPK